MANLTRFDPFGEVTSLFDDLSKGLFRPVGFGQMPEMPGRIKIDVKEDGAAYTVHADIPGVKKEDIHVSLEGNQVTISAEVKKETEEKEDEHVVHSERYFGKVMRSFKLGQEVESAGATAKYSDGVL
ncbi:MAG TPA: Hsp20/alpha crystallin family protein, partial [Burkholderiales bacterium]|nr:Hsp20/alpha crystallin family protein [Burkholderiales bacterium]